MNAPRPRRRVVIRANRLHALSFVLVLAFGLGAGIEAMLSLRKLFSVMFIGFYIAFLLVAGASLLWLFWGWLRRVWLQRIVFDDATVLLRGGGQEERLHFSSIADVRLSRSPGGFHQSAGQQIGFQLREHPEHLLWFDAFDFSLRAVLKALRELSRRVPLAPIPVAQWPNSETEEQLRWAAKWLGQVALDEQTKKWSFHPFGALPENDSNSE